MKQGNVTTLNQFVVRRTHFDVPAELPSDLEKLILKKMYTRGAEVVKLQCGREYFPDNTEPLRATAIHALSAEAREGLPTNNLKPERTFSHFSRLAEAGKQRNQTFLATNIL